MSSSLGAWKTPKTMRSPSGEKSGSNSSRSVVWVSLVRPVPSRLTIQRSVSRPMPGSESRTKTIRLPSGEKAGWKSLPAGSATRGACAVPFERISQMSPSTLPLLKATHWPVGSTLGPRSVAVRPGVRFVRSVPSGSMA